MEITTSLISTKRYIRLHVLKIIGLDNIDKFLEAIQYNNINYVRNTFKIELDKGNGLELIQMNNTLDQTGEVVSIVTIGIILFIDINNVSAEFYKRD